MNANAVSAVVVEEIARRGTLTVLTVSLGSGEHWDMYQNYANLPSVVEFDGTLYGKSSWNSDNGKAYYRNDLPIALAQ